MRSLRFLLVPLSIIACSEQAPVEPVLEGPAFDWMNNPDVGNFKVYRYENQLATCWTDPATGLRACHATIPLGGGSEPDCGLQDPADPIAWQSVLVDESAFRAVTNSAGDVWVTIRDQNAAGACFGSGLVAEGWGTLRYTDNDTFGSGSDNANQWGFTATGGLTSPGGDPVRYSGHARYYWNRNQLIQPVSLQVTVN